jgi:hypothetical protein
MLHGYLKRQPWRSRAIQVLIALLFWASPIVFAPAALHEEQTGLWVRAGLSGSVIEKLILPGGTASFRYALVAGKGIYQAHEEPTTTPFALGTRQGEMLWQSVDADLPSKRWNNVEVQALAADSIDPAVIYAGMGGSGSRDPTRSAGLYVTSDGGKTWQNPVKSIAGQEVQAIAVMVRTLSAAEQTGAGTATSATTSGLATQGIASTTVVCAATAGGIYCNTGAGQSWVGLDWRGTERVLSLAIRPGDPRSIYIGTEGFGVVITRDGGVTWKLSSAELRNRQVYDIAISVSRPDIVYVATDDGLFRSADAGSTWTELGGPTEGRRVNTIALSAGAVVSGKTNTLAAPLSAEEGVLYVGLQYGAAYYSVDSGRNWVALNKGLGSMTVLTLALDAQNPPVLWAGTTDGVWRCTLPVAQGQVLPSSSLSITPAATFSPSPQQGGALAATVTFPAENAGLITETPTALPSVTPTSSATATTLPTLTATSTLRPTATRTVQPSPTRTRTPSPIPTRTPTPSPPPVPPRPTETRVPR